MSYENPPLPQDVNVSRDNPLVEFLRLAAGLALVVTGLSLAVYLAADRLARLIPPETELALVGDRVLGIDIGKPAKAEHAIEAYLQEITDRLARQMEMPEGLPLRVHYIDTSLPNAFAALGGHIAVTRGLYERMPSENALALVLAHEIAHIRARDPIGGLAGSATMLLAIALASGDAANLSSTFAVVVQRGYSRQAEARADEAGIAAVKRVYGHAGGGSEAFEVLARDGRSIAADASAVLSTHPTDRDRINRMKAAAEGWDPAKQPLQALAVRPPKSGDAGSGPGR